MYCFSQLSLIKNAESKCHGKGVMLAETPLIWLAIINTVGIPITHLLVAWLSTLLPQAWFRKASDTSPSTDGKSTACYETVFFIRSWKGLLPDGAAWFKGFPKGTLESKDPNYLRTFIAETRRGELSHWLQVIAISSFTLFNPWPAILIIVVYSIISNTPCILNLRYTRVRMLRVLANKPSDC